MQHEPTETSGFDRTLDAWLQRLAASRAFSMILIVLGAAFRLVQFLSGRSLWHDEATITLDVMDRSVGQLFQPSPLYGQTAPVGFLIGERIFGTLFHFTEAAMRAWPLVAGLLSLPLCYLLARRILKPLGVQVALGLFAISGPLIYYASEVKPYSGDVLFTLLLFWLGLKLLEPEPGHRWLVIAAIGGAIALWFSHVAFFGALSVGLVVVVPKLRRGRIHKLIPFLPVFAAWGISGLACYVLYLSRVSASHFLFNFWHEFFMPLPPKSTADLFWFGRTFLEIFGYSAGLPAAGLAAFCAVIGAFSLGRRRGRVLALLLLPALAALLLSGIGKYPFVGRLILFLVPSALLLIGEGIDYLHQKIGAAGGTVVWVLLVLLALNPGVQALQHVKHPVVKADVRSALELIAERAGRGDTIYLNYGSIRPYRYYERRGLNLHDVIISDNPHDRWNWDVVQQDLAKLQGHQRVWILFSGVWRDEHGNEKDLFLSEARRLGHESATWAFAGADVYLFDFSGN